MKFPKLPALVLLMLMTQGTACDKLEEDVAPLEKDLLPQGTPAVYASPSGTTVINLAERIKNTSSYSIEITTQPQKGSLRADPKGFLLYQPAQSFTQGTDYIGYTILEGSKTIASDVLTIVVNPITSTYPCQAGAMSDSLAIQAEANTSLPVLANDQICEGAAIMLSVVSPPAHGKISQEGNSISFVPNAGFSGSDEFIYQLCQTAEGSKSSCSYAYVHVFAYDFDPGCELKAVDDNYQLTFHGVDTIYQLPVRANDQLCALTGTLPQLAAPHDNAWAANGYLYYQLKAVNFNSSDSLGYSLCAEAESCSLAKVYLNITKADGFCTFTAKPDAYTIAADSAGTPGHEYISLPVLNNDALCNTQIHSFKISVAPTKGHAYAENDTIWYQQSQGTTGTDILKYSVCTIEGVCAETDVSLHLE